MRHYKLLIVTVFLAGLQGCASYLPRSADTVVRAPSPEQPSARSPDLLLHALAMSGFDYQRGGKSVASGFDCSGLVAHVFKQAYGMNLPHNAKAQSAYGKPVPASQLEAGDLVFFNTLQQPFSHVGIYLGDNRFIHAPRPGAVVRTENMKLAYWRTRFDGARRIVD
jgi:cell wall-associated NlpC family hydrolase